MNCFTIQLKPFDPIDRNNNTIGTFQNGCIQTKLFGMGFHIKALFANQTTPLFMSNAGLEYERAYHNNPDVIANPEWRKSFSRTLHLYQRIQAGDYVLTRLYGSGACYIGKTTSEPFYDRNFVKAQKIDELEKFSWIVPVEQWKLIGNFKHNTLDESIRKYFGFPYIVPTIFRLPEAVHKTIQKAYSEHSL